MRIFQQFRSITTLVLHHRVELDKDHEVSDQGCHEAAEHPVVDEEETKGTETHLGDPWMEPVH